MFGSVLGLSGSAGMPVVHLRLPGENAEGVLRELVLWQEFLVAWRSLPFSW